MQSTAPNVDAYLAEVPAARRDVLTAIRQLCRDTLTGYEEEMDYGMPSYKRDGVIDVAFNSQKHYISIYVPVDVLAAHRRRVGWRELRQVVYPLSASRKRSILRRLGGF